MNNTEKVMTRISQTGWVIQKPLAVLALCFLWAGAAGAASVSSADVQLAVTGWLARDAFPLDAPMQPAVASVQEFSAGGTDPLFHVASLEDGGFVVTSADDEIEPILCFSASGTFDASTNSPLYVLLKKDLTLRTKAFVRGTSTSQTSALKTVAASTSISTTSDAAVKWSELMQAGASTSLVKTISFSSVGTTSLEDLSDVRVAPLVQST
jgi:hypothetical protein